MLLLALHLFGQVAPPEDSLAARWGQAPYSEDVRSFAEWCMSGPGPAPERCEQDGVWMTGTDAKAILDSDALSPTQAAIRRSRRATGLAYLRRVAMAGGRELGSVLSFLAAHATSVWATLAATTLFGGTWLWAWSRKPRCSVTVDPRGVVIDRERIPLEDILAVEIIAGSLRFTLTRGRDLMTPPLDVGEIELHQLVVAIRALLLSPEQRRALATDTERIDSEREELRAQRPRLRT